MSKQSDDHFRCQILTLLMAHVSEMNAINDLCKEAERRMGRHCTPVFMKISEARSAVQDICIQSIIHLYEEKFKNDMCDKFSDSLKNKD